MALTPSTMQLSLGAEAPDFALPDPDGKIHSLGDFAGRPALLVAFICNHCPYVKHIAPAFAQLAKEYQEQGVGVVAINANDFEHYPDDSPAKMKEEIARPRLHVPLSRRRVAAGRQGLSGRVHARLLSLRRRSEAGLSRPDGRQPSRQQPARHRQGPPRGAGRRPGRPARSEGPAAQHRLQHQVAAGQFTRVFRLILVRRIVLQPVLCFRAEFMDAPDLAIIDFQTIHVLRPESPRAKGKGQADSGRVSNQPRDDHVGIPPIAAAEELHRALGSPTNGRMIHAI